MDGDGGRCYYRVSGPASVRFCVDDAHAADKFVSVSINALVRVHSMSFPSDSNCLVYQLCVHMNLKQIIIMQYVCSYVVECVYFKL